MNNKLVKQKNRVQGVVITKAIMANQNADFDSYPRQTNDNKYFATDNSLKFTIKQMANGKGNDVFGIERKKYSEKLGALQPLSLEETYIKLFGDFPKAKDKDATKIILSNLGKCFDVKTFGCTFAHKEFAQSIKGSIQFCPGFNTIEDTETMVLDILSPYRNKEDSIKTTVGQRFLVDKAVFAFDLTVNPNTLNEFEEFGLFLDTKTVEDFKRYATLSTTEYNSCAKSGCDNVMSIFVNLKEDSDRLLLPLSEYLKVEYEEPMTKVDLTKMESYLELVKDDIESIELMYSKGTNVEIVKNSKELNYIIQEI